MRFIDFPPTRVLRAGSPVDMDYGEAAAHPARYEDEKAAAIGRAVATVHGIMADDGLSPLDQSDVVADVVTFIPDERSECFAYACAGACVRLPGPAVRVPVEDTLVVRSSQGRMMAMRAGWDWIPLNDEQIRDIMGP